MFKDDNQQRNCLEYWYTQFTQLQIMYKKILVPHAGTSAGDKALKHAVHIAKYDSSEILDHTIYITCFGTRAQPPKCS